MGSLRDLHHEKGDEFVPEPVILPARKDCFGQFDKFNKRFNTDNPPDCDNCKESNECSVKSFVRRCDEIVEESKKQQAEWEEKWAKEDEEWDREKEKWKQERLQDKKEWKELSDKLKDNSDGLSEELKSLAKEAKDLISPSGGLKAIKQKIRGIFGGNA